MVIEGFYVIVLILIFRPALNVQVPNGNRIGTIEEGFHNILIIKGIRNGIRIPVPNVENTGTGILSANAPMFI